MKHERARARTRRDRSRNITCRSRHVRILSLLCSLTCCGGVVYVYMIFSPFPQLQSYTVNIIINTITAVACNNCRRYSTRWWRTGHLIRYTVTKFVRLVWLGVYWGELFGNAVVSWRPVGTCVMRSSCIQSKVRPWGVHYDINVMLYVYFESCARPNVASARFIANLRAKPAQKTRCVNEISGDRRF